jgi:hypothetical protein
LPSAAANAIANASILPKSKGIAPPTKKKAMPTPQLRGLTNYMSNAAATTASTCAQCTQFCDNICLLKSTSDWDDASKVSADRPACHFFQSAAEQFERYKKVRSAYHQWKVDRLKYWGFA